MINKLILLLFGLMAGVLMVQSQFIASFIALGCGLMVTSKHVKEVSE